MGPHSTRDRKDVEVAVDPTDTVLDSFVLPNGCTGIEWQVKNTDVSQALSCRPQVRAGAAADWAAVPFTDELASIPAGESARVMWRFVSYEVRLLGVASGAGLDARLWRSSIFGVQP